MNEPNFSALGDKLVSLKQTWIRTEPWLPKVLNTLYKKFQTCREKLSNANASDKDRILAEYYYNIALFYKSLFEKYSINLLACTKYLEISKTFSTNSTKKYTFDEKYKILTREITEKCNLLENKFKLFYPIDWIMYYIALGKIDDIKLCMLNIDDSFDKKQFLHLKTVAQNIELLQIINNLEDDIMISANDNVCVVLERYNMLSKSYEISGENSISKQYFDKGESLFNESLLDIDEDDENKESINDIILKEVHSIEDDPSITLLEIIENISNKNQVEICRNIDAIIIEREYIKLCLKLWYDEVEDFCNNLIETKDYKVIEEIIATIFGVKNLLEISIHFKNLKYYDLLNKHYILIPNNVERNYISRLHKDISIKTRGYLKKLENECKFFEIFFNFLNNIKCIRDVIKNLELERFCKGDIEFYNVIKNILNLSISNEYKDIYNELKEISNIFRIDQTIFLKEKFQEMIRPYLEKVEIKTKNSGDRIYVEVKGKIIIISEILEKLCIEVRDQSVKEVHFIATNTIHIDGNLVKDIWHGNNIVILTKKLIIHGSNVVWDVSGMDNNHKYTNNAGNEKNGDGKCGANGCPGESGGNVLIEVDDCENEMNFCVISKGGNGTRGQDGGNGINGKDGHGISYEEFKSKFPGAAAFCSLNNYDKTIETILPLVSQMVKDETKNFLFNGHHRYIEAKLPPDNEIIFSYYSSKLLIKHVFLLYKGSLGESGGQGGENGLGGRGGFGGEISADTLKIKQISETGKKGNDGNCGFYGSPGKNGWDIAYTDYSPDVTNSWPKLLGKDCQSKLDIKCYKGSGPNRVWCETYKKYIEISEKELEPITSRHFDERRLNSRGYDINRDHDVAAIKKKSISKNDIKGKYSHLFEISENEIIKQMKSNMENARTRALQTVSEETEQRVEESVQLNVHRKSNFSVNKKKSNKKKVSLQIKFKRNKNYQNILSNINSIDIIDEYINNCYQLRNIPLKYHEIQSIFFDSKNRYDRIPRVIQNENIIKKFENLYNILFIKYRFAVFEEIVKNHNFNSYKANETYSSDIIIRSLRVVIKDDKDGRHSIADSVLGSLNQYVFNDSPELRRQIMNYLEEFKELIKDVLISSIEAFVLIDREHTEGLPDVNKHFDNYQKFDREKKYNTGRLKEEFESKLKKCGLYKKYCSNENRPEFEMLLEKPGLVDLYKELNTELEAVYEWFPCIFDIQFYEAYKKHIQTKAFSNAYFELLSQLFEVNIVIYEENDYNGYEIKKFFNKNFERKLRLLSVDQKFVELETDEEWAMLLTEQKNVDIIYGQILSKLLSFKYPQEFDIYLKNEEFKQPNKVEVCPTTSSNINIVDIIEYFSSSSSMKTLLKNRLNKIELLSKNQSNNRIILESILSRFSYEGCHISINEIISIIDDILMSYLWNNKYNVFTWILQAWPQNCWTNEFLILTIENYVKHRLLRKAKIRDYLMGIDNKEILLLFKIKLEKLSNQNRVTYECIENIFYLLSNIDTEIYNLEDLSLNEWQFALKDSYWQSKLKRSFKLDEDEDKHSITTICYNIQQLENTFGKASIDHFFEMVKEKISISQLEKILKIFLRLDNNVWAFDKSINFQNAENMERYIENLDSSHNINNVRDISELCKIVSANANTSKIILSNLSYIEKNLILIRDDAFNFQFIDSFHANLKEKDIKTWIRQFKNKLNELPPKSLKRYSYITDLRFEMLVVIDKGIKIVKNFNLRDTQKLAILSMILNNFECKEIRNTLAQVSTGEGKTFIVLAITIMKALCAEKVDVITSSSVLAKRDAEIETKEIYKLFDITVSHNCSENIETRKKAYSENQVIYGDLGNFQRDYLLDHFYKRNILGDRKFENVIVDEVDSMLLDKGNNMLYISHEICGLDKLESVYIYIWQRINRPARTSEEFRYNFDVQLIKDEILNDIFGVIKLEDINTIGWKLNSKQIDEMWNILFDSNIIDRKGKLLVDNTITIIDNNEFDNLLKKQELFLYKDRIEYLINEKITRERLIHVPNYLRSFIEDHLESWIKSALCALCMQESHNYVVDVDRTETSSDLNPNIIIIDNDTGTDQNNSQWDNCLHQFLQLKHGCKLSMQSLKAVFISNVTYLKLYENLYGLTGTLGSEQERDFLKEIHNVNFVTIPTAKPSRFIEFESQICSSEKDWIEKIVANTKEMIKGNQKSVLIICETVEHVRKISKAFAGGDVIPENLHTYTRDFQEFSIAKENFKLRGGHVIVATNLAGRGTDIKISEELNKSGGLHVCLTYLPANERIEQQAFGRAARKGERGSGILIIENSEIKLTNGTNFEVVYDLKQKRDFEELYRISEIKNYYYNQIVHEEDCFRKFHEQYNYLGILLDDNKTHKDIKEILLGAIFDRWAFWLDENNKFIKDFSDNEIKLRFDESIDNFIKKLECLSCDKYSEWVNDFPVQAVRLGIKLLELDLDDLGAVNLFDEIIANDPKFCEAAHYFKAYAFGKRNPVEYHLVEKELMSAAKLFEKHSNNAACASRIINYMKEGNKCHIVQSDAFVKQKENICNIYNIYIDSIDYILGHQMTSEKFTNGTKISHELAELLYNDLLTNGILLKPKINHNNGKDKGIEKLALDYGVSFDILDKLIMGMDGTEIDNMIDFQKKLETSLLLPSREGFWQILINKKMLYNEIEYVVINTEKLKSIDIDLEGTIQFKIREKVFNKQTFANAHNNQLILYSEQIKQENTIILKRNDFLEIVEHDKYETLLRVGVFCLNKSANIKVDRGFFFDEFDSVTLNDIANENITRTEANTIFTLLLDKNIVRHVNGVYRLAIPYYDLNKINLNGYSIYKESVVSLLNLCFMYRIALEKIYNDLSNKINNVIEISLMAKPHTQLIFDLIEQNIVMSATVKVTDYKERLKSIYNNNGDYYRIGLKDETTLASICEILEQCGRKLENITSWHLKPIVELFGGNDYGNVQEIHMFSLNGLKHIIDLKQKWSWKMSVNCFIVLIFGIASIVIPALFETFSAGVLGLGLAFLTKGINHIISAISALRPGYFSWKDYRINKATSLLLTVITAGVGVFLTKAFRLGRFGNKVASAIITNIEETPNKSNWTLLKSAFHEIRSGIETGSFIGRNTKTITNKVNVSSNRIKCNDVEKLMKNITFGLLDNIGNVIFKHNMPSDFDKTFEILGREETKNLIDEITEECLSKPCVFDRFLQITQTLTKCMEKIVTETSSIKNFGKKVMGGKVSAIDIVDEALKWTTKAKDIQEMNEMIMDILMELNSEIKSRCKNIVVKSVNITNMENLQELNKEIFQSWNKQLQEKLRQFLTQEMLDPVLANANKILNQSNKKNLKKLVRFNNDKETKKLKYYIKFGKLKKGYIKIFGTKISEEHKMYVDNYIIQKYQRILMLLLAKFKSSELFSAIISENVPMNLACLKTCTILIPCMLKEMYNINVDGIKIIAKQDNSQSGKFCIVAEGNKKPLTKTFELSNDYFQIKNDESENILTDLHLSNKNVANDYLFNALLLPFMENISNIAIREFRNNFANFIQNNKWSRNAIEGSYDWVKCKKSHRKGKDTVIGQSHRKNNRKNFKVSKFKRNASNSSTGSNKKPEQRTVNQSDSLPTTREENNSKTFMGKLYARLNYR